MNTAPYTIEPVPGLVATHEVCHGPDRTVLGVIAEIDGRWRVLSTRYGAPEPQPGSFPTAEAAADTLIPERTI